MNKKPQLKKTETANTAEQQVTKKIYIYRVRKIVISE